MIPVLYTSAKSNYLKFDFFDCYDAKRNALSYNSNLPVIAHPPCRLFSRLKAFSTAPACEKLLGYSAISLVRRVGGVVENPRSSDLWSTMKVGVPGAPDRYGGYLISVDLSWFGFPARKKTGLYICGLPYSKLPALPLNFNAITHTIGSSQTPGLSEIPKKERSSTPEYLCLWLKAVIELIDISH